MSKPNCFSSCLMNSGSRPCAPRYFDDPPSTPEAPSAPPRAPKSPPGEPEMRDVAPVSEPDNCAITRSTGPPGANCTTANDTSMIPSKVGIISSTRRMIYAPMIARWLLSSRPCREGWPARPTDGRPSDNSLRLPRDQNLAPALQFGGLCRIVPPGFRNAAGIFWLALGGTVEHVPIGDPVRRLVPMRNPVAARTGSRGRAPGRRSPFRAVYWRPRSCRPAHRSPDRRSRRGSANPWSSAERDEK